MQITQTQGHPCWLGELGEFGKSGKFGKFGKNSSVRQTAWIWWINHRLLWSAHLKNRYKQNTFEFTGSVPVMLKENIWLIITAGILYHIRLCKQSYNREWRLEFAYPYLKLSRAKSRFCHGFADWEPCFILSKLCIWKVLLSKSLHVFPSCSFTKRNWVQQRRNISK